MNVILNKNKVCVTCKTGNCFEWRFEIVDKNQVCIRCNQIYKMDLPYEANN